MLPATVRLMFPVWVTVVLPLVVWVYELVVKVKAPTEALRVPEPVFNTKLVFETEVSRVSDPPERITKSLLAIKLLAEPKKVRSPVELTDR